MASSFIAASSTLKTAKNARINLNLVPALQYILHVTWLVADLARARAFYEGILGLAPDPARPDLGFAGVWYALPGGQQIHLMALPNPDPTEGRIEHGGRDRHVAVAVTGLDELAATLERAGVDFTRSRSGRAALFVRDPDGNTLELVEI